LLDARVSAKETTNCKLSGEENKDFHLDLVSFRDAPKSTIVAAEITPRLRKSGWDFEKLDYLGEEQFCELSARLLNLGEFGWFRQQ